MNRREGVELIHEGSFAIGCFDALTDMSKSETMRSSSLSQARNSKPSTTPSTTRPRINLN